MHIRVLTSCTKTKTVDCPDDSMLERADFEAGEERLEQREQDLAAYCRPAGEMYGGRQHKELMRGVQAFRTEHPDATVDVHILSAGYGVISEDRVIAPYNVTFSDMSDGDIRDWADAQEMPSEVRDVLAAPADLTLFLLGGKYATAAGIDENADLGSPVLFFCNKKTATMLPDLPQLKPVVVSQREATRFSEGIVWLKGHLARRLLVRLMRDPTFLDTVTRPESDVLDLLDEQIAMPLDG